VWLIVHELSFYVSAQKKSNKHKMRDILGMYKESLLLLFNNVYSSWERAERAQFNVLFQNITLLFFLVAK
jgi:hypothetical protein